MMGRIWLFMIALSIISAVFNDKIPELSVAVTDGAAASINLIFSIGGMILLWSGVIEIMKRSGLSDKLTKFLSPLLAKLFPDAKHNSSVMNDISANVSANLLGLGNAATPAGIRAAEGLHLLGNRHEASDDLCMLVVINTASLQLIPTTIAALRASLGAVAPYDILPAVWLASAISQIFGIFSAKFFSGIWRKKT